MFNPYNLKIPKSEYFDALHFVIAWVDKIRTISICALQKCILIISKYPVYVKIRDQCANLLSGGTI